MAIIQEGLNAKVMRNKMECKDALIQKGALYVGTGDTMPITPDDGGDAVRVPITSSIAPSGDDDGEVLITDSTSGQGWRIGICPRAYGVIDSIGHAKITDIFESGGTIVKIATVARGLQSNTAQLTNGTNWYEFNDKKEYFGSTNYPTIIKTSEARPKAEVKSGGTTVTKEVALVEDIPQVGEWITVTGETATLTEAGTYQVIAGVTDMQSIVYWDGKTQAYGTRNTLPLVTANGSDPQPSIYCAYPHIGSNGQLSVQYYYISTTWNNSSYVWHKTDISNFSGFKYSKIH